MSLSFNTISLTLAGAFIIASFSGPALAGKIAGEKIKPEMKYKISTCERPEKPKIKGNTRAEYNASVAAFEAYTSTQHDFADCVEREVGTDMKTLQEVVFTGGQEAIAHSQRDIDNIKHELDFLRAQLEKK